jgi:hypothetical protein
VRVAVELALGRRSPCNRADASSKSSCDSTNIIIGLVLVEGSMALPWAYVGEHQRRLMRTHLVGSKTAVSCKTINWMGNELNGLWPDRIEADMSSSRENIYLLICTSIPH